jgi:hypothetical protein
MLQEDDKFSFEVNVLNEAQRGLIDRSVFITQKTETV